MEVQNWRDLPPTKKQLTCIFNLYRYNKWVPEFKGDTRGEASDFIARHLAIINEKKEWKKIEREFSSYYY